MTNRILCAICIHIGPRWTLNPRDVTLIDGTAVCGDHVSLLTTDNLRRAIEQAREDGAAVKDR